MIPQAPSSNRTSGFPQYGFPTTFPVRLSATVVVDTQLCAPDTLLRACSPLLFRLQFSLLSATVSLHGIVPRQGLDFSWRVYSIAATRTAHSRILPSTRHSVEARPYARDGLCCSVRHHFRAAPTSPAPVTHLLPVSPNLRHAYRRWSPAETRGSQVRSPVIFPCMPLTLPRVPDRCAYPLLPDRQWPSPQT